MSGPVTPLETEIRRRIAAAGPMPVGEFMTLCLTDPKHGYYVTRDPLGAGGDFTTAPEVSQMFGELIGLWMVNVWQQLGSPENVRIIELGPGRGTMMRDALRAAKVAPGFGKAAVLHFVEVSAPLRTLQEQNAATLDIAAYWHTSIADVPAGVGIVVANEFFDALPVNQAVKMADGWHRRAVGIGKSGALAFVADSEPLRHFDSTLPPAVRAARAGDIFEWRADKETMELGRRLSREPGAALIVDYGHAESAVGETLQAVREHQFAEPFDTPGEADLTAHVDFQALGGRLQSFGAAVFGPIEQGQFLNRLGIHTRAATLKANAARAGIHEIDGAVARLTGSGRTDMGSMFKVMVATHPGLATPAGFET